MVLPTTGFVRCNLMVALHHQFSDETGSLLKLVSK